MEVVFYTEKKEEFGTSINCQLYSACTVWDEEKEEDVTKKDELIAWSELYIPQVESTVNEDWFDL